MSQSLNLAKRWLLFDSCCSDFLGDNLMHFFTASVCMTTINYNLEALKGPFGEAMVASKCHSCLQSCDFLSLIKITSIQDVSIKSFSSLKRTCLFTQDV